MQMTQELLPGQHRKLSPLTLFANMKPRIALVLLLAVPGLYAAQPVFAPEDVFSLSWASDPQVSPDGSFVVYSHNFMDIMEDRRRSNLWRIDIDGENARPLTTGAVNDSGARIAPDNERVAYLSGDDQGVQIFVRWIESGETLQVTHLDRAPGSLSWSPDGEWLAYTMLVPYQPPAMGELPARPEGANWADPPVVVERAVYRMDGAGPLPYGFNHVFVVSAQGGAPRQLTSGDFNHDGPISWSPDSQSLYFSGNRHEDAELNPNNSEIYRVGLDGGEIEAITNREGPDNSVDVSPDGAMLAWTGYDDRARSYQITRLYVMNVDGSGYRELLPDLDRDVTFPSWSADGNGLYFAYEDEGLTKLAYAHLDGGLTEISGELSGLALTRPYTGAQFAVGGGDMYAITRGDALAPSDIAVGRGMDAPRRLTQLNANLLDYRDLGRVEEFRFPSSYDGEEIHAWVVWPPGFDASQQYPLLLEIHGGPHAAYGPHFSLEVQLYAAAGYVVVYANPRGSSSYGEAFGSYIHHNYPSEDYDDLMSVVDAVIDLGVIDPDQLYVTGGSGGGVLTAWIVGKTDRFRAAVVAKPVINWISFALSADMAPVFTRNWFPALPWEDPMGYWERSPLSLAGEVTTPTMLLTGEQDWRTPMWESEQYYQALKLRGVETALVRIPDASHSIAARPSQLLAKVSAVLEWFERHSGKPEN
ncbi:MAG: S9 family peptidase [Gammaproteobacteria bacterium]|nr:S9 family peptidase [Gammaproteobacteria bacterium]MXZ32932.1 S9 family peptidase [Gammaproteobacteria bacterium]MYF00874.1 S9 family peptidase [Gammaproteobacteria bacterium]MYG95081.1 S9 family peptidase [Gammaproteobacteria bacterium]